MWWYWILSWMAPEWALLTAQSLASSGRPGRAAWVYRQLLARLSRTARPDRPRWRHLLGQAYLGLGHLSWQQQDRRQALTYYQTAYDLGAKDDDALVRLARSQLGHDCPEEALSLVTAVTSRSGPLRLILGRVYLKLGRLKEAEVELGQANRKLPADPEPYYYLGCALGRATDLVQAERHFSRALALRPGYAAAYLQRGHARLRAGRLDEARDDYRQAERLGHGAEAAAGYACLGLNYGQRGEHELACEVLSQASKLGLCGDALLYQLGWSAYHLGRWSLCEESWTALWDKHRDHLPLRRQLALALYTRGAREAREGRWDNAVEPWRRVLKVAPGARAVTRALAEAHFRCAAADWTDDRDALKEARQHLTEARRLDPEDARAAYYLTLLEARDGTGRSRSDAVACETPFRARDERGDYTRALLLCRGGQEGQGAELLARLAADWPGTPWAAKATLALATLSAQAGRWSDAVVHLMAASSPGHAPAWPEQLESTRRSLLGMTLLQAGQLEELLVLGPDDEHLAPFKARGLAQAGRRQEAVSLLLRLTADGRSVPESRRLLAGLLCETAAHHAAAERWADGAAAFGEAFAQDDWGREWSCEDSGASRVLAVLCVLGNRRQDAARLCEGRQSAKPQDMVAAHTLLVLAFWEAVKEGALDPAVPVTPAWDRVIRNAAMLLQGNLFWTEWVACRGDRYGTAIDSAIVDELRSRLEQDLSLRLPLDVPTGRLWRVELAAAAELHERSNVPPPSKGVGLLACGPLMLRHLDGTEQFARYMRGLLEEQAGLQTTAEFLGILARFVGAEVRGSLPVLGSRVQRLGRYFSRLGEAQVLLEQGRPRDALAALRSACCAACAGRYAEDRAGGGWLPRVCVEECAQFAAANPAFAGVPDCGRRLREAALELAAEAHLAATQALLTAARVRWPRVRAHCRKSLVRALEAGTVAGIRKALADLALGRANALLHETRLEDAVRLLHIVHALCDGPERDLLNGRLAEVLNYRGVERGNREPPDWKGSVRDLRRSVRLNPHVPQRFDNLAHALVALAEERRRAPRAAARLLGEASQVLEQGLMQFAGHPGLLEHRIALEFMRFQASARLNQRALHRLGRRRYEAGLEDLWVAYELTPQLPALSENLCRGTLAAGKALLERGETSRATELLGRYLAVFPMRPELYLLFRLLFSG